ncbi:MAG: hypothetical protein KDD91_21610, partial [Caldilinea sp.]|nr:hypothetical protein [Caldilinea sp.]
MIGTGWHAVYDGRTHRVHFEAWAMLVTQNWPYAMIAFSAAVIGCGLAIYAWRRRAVRGAGEFALLMMGVAWMGAT